MYQDNTIDSFNSSMLRNISLILPQPVLLSFHPQLLNSQSTNKVPQHSSLGPYFQDGQRRIDYILTYHVDKLERTRHHSSSTFKSLKDNLSCIGRRTRSNSSHHDLESASNAHIHRDEFEQKMMDMGLELEREEDVSIQDFSFLTLQPNHSTPPTPPHALQYVPVDRVHYLILLL